MSDDHSHEYQTYSFPAFLRDHLFVILAAFLFVFVMDITVYPFVSGWELPLFLDILFIGFVAFVIAYEYRRQAHFYMDANELIDAQIRPEHFIDMLPDATSLDTAFTREMLTQAIAMTEAERLRLRAESESRREYIELWVHEIKTPIAASMLVLNDLHDENAAKLKREMERISASVERSLYYSRSESVSSDYFIREHSLMAMINAACKANMRMLTHKDIRIDMDVDDTITVLTDRMWTEFIISQIISNSAKYDSSFISFSAHEEGEGILGRTVLVVADDGCGIPAEDVPRVFEHSFTGSVGRKHGSATGIGLYLVARLCERLGLNVELASEEGSGTRVMISFPHDRTELNLLR